MANTMRSRAYPARADELWAVIGDFHAIAGWHPAVERQTAEGDLRHLHLPGGGVIVERLLGQDGMSYAYEIVSSPLPVADYRSVVAVAPAGEGCVVVWSSTYEPTAAGAGDVVAGIYDAGFGALADRFPGAG